MKYSSSFPKIFFNNYSMEFGIYTFVENTPDPETGQKLAPEERLSNLMEEIELADKGGLDLFGIGEHHREEYLSSSPSTDPGGRRATHQGIFADKRRYGARL
ncbi:MAG: hypothetical protein U5K69_27790 [Balneolaceae bacterium]|nr:hypothetical protein [Balneolaceae bacterium]